MTLLSKSPMRFAPRRPETSRGLRLAASVIALLLLCLAHVGAKAQASPPAAAEPRFDVMEFRVEGNSVLSIERIERVVYPFMGEKRTVADVEAARVALEAAYRDAGYGTVVVDTPEQRIVEGIVTLQVVEAPVSRVRVVGSRYFSQGRILEKVPALAEGAVPNFTAASAQLATVNRTADRRVTPLLRPGKVPGTTEVDLTVEDKLPLHGSLELNNKYGMGTTPARVQASLRYDNLWQRDHSVSAQLQLSPQNTSEVQVISGSYTLPVGNGSVVFSALKSNSNTVAGGSGTNVFGSGRILGVLGIVPLDGSDTLSHSVTLGADYKAFKEAVSVGEAQGFQTPISYLPLSASYSATVSNKEGYWRAGGGLTFAVRGLGSKESQFADKRYKAQSNFSVLKFNLSRQQNLPGDLSLYGSVDAQLSGQALISNEQLVAGGVDSVRGYLVAAAVGDKGVRTSVELRSGQLFADSLGPKFDLRAHAFADGAALWLNDPLPGQTARFGLASVGLGLRVQANQSLTFALDLGWPLHDAGQAKKGSPRLHASGVFGF